ncbi:MAG: 3-(3-hydroxy-phenyl)propionate/3-hydroxycinnamic acid hydroxylase, partial [Pseudomonadota bacterium]
PMDDAPMQCDGKAVWLIDSVGGHFQCLVFVEDVTQIDARTRQSLLALREASVPIEPVLVSQRAGVVEGMRVLVDVQGLFAKRYDAQTESVWLLRPDQHIAARWRSFESQAVEKALRVAMGSSMAAA